MPTRRSNPPNPWESTHVEWLEEPPEATLEVFEEQARSALSENASPDLPFRYSLNPYRGCFHGCAYCYARPSHGYLGFGAGTDFERKIVVKVNIAERLRERLRKRSWGGHSIAFSGNTDCYQPLEASYGLTRRCLEVCAEHGNPVGVITRSRLVARDAELLARLSRETGSTVHLSIPFADAADARAIEPYAPAPARRFETLAALAAAGVRCGVSLAPVIPGLNDHQIPEILERARAAGAGSAFMTLLRLPRETGPVFEERLREAMPRRAERVLASLADVRDGHIAEGRFGLRHRGLGPRWTIIRQLFERRCAALGLETGSEAAVLAIPSRPRGVQGTLFDP